MIRFENISLDIHRQTLLSDASLHVAESDKVVIRGPSGCGKSSLMKTVVGALPLTGGTVSVDRLEVNAANIAQIRSRIAYIGQEPILGTDNVREALLLPFSYKVHKGSQPSDEIIIGTLSRLHLPANILDKPSKRISGGEKQRIAIARALLLNKTIFLADEITSALDPESKSAVIAALFKPEFTILSVSHDPDWISACSRTVEIADLKLKESVGLCGAASMEKTEDPQIGNRQSAIPAPEVQRDG